MHKIVVHIYSNTPQSQHSCVSEGFMCRVVSTSAAPSPLWSASNENREMLKTEECHGVVPKAERALGEKNGGMNFSVLVELRRRCEGNDPAYRVEFGPRTTGM